jgi:hypothetical protein
VFLAQLQSKKQVVHQQLLLHQLLQSLLLSQPQKQVLRPSKTTQLLLRK